MTLRSRIIWLALAALTIAAPSLAAPAAPERAAALTSADVETFFDRALPDAMRGAGIAGAVVTVVKGDKVLLAKGYGAADLQRHLPMDAERTLVRVGSVTKLVTWTAVMQLVAAGKLDLDQDVNSYLDFRIAPRPDGPVTLRTLMTHTAGFEEGLRGLFVRTPDRLMPLGTYLRAYQPRRIYPSGTTAAYSNYGAALAGYIVQRVSGEPFATYAETHVLKPLGMTHTTFAQPLPPPLDVAASRGYRSSSDPRAEPYELFQPAPAGGLATTAADMGRFMIFHLGAASSDAAQVLSPSALALMHARQYTPSPGMNGLALGFFSGTQNGHSVLSHDGDTVVFHSDLRLAPDAGVGVFLDFNSSGGSGGARAAQSAIMRAFFDRYLPPGPTPEEPTLASARRDASGVTGWYQPTRRVAEGQGLWGLFNQVEVAARPDGAITVSNLRGAGGGPIVWREIAPRRYRQTGGMAYLQFVADSMGRIRGFSSSDRPLTTAYEPVPPGRGRGFAELAPILAGAVFTVALLVWGLGAAIRRARRRPLGLSTGRRRLRLASRLGILVQWAGLLAWPAFFALQLSDPVGFLSGAGDGQMQALFALSALGLAGAVAVWVYAASTWRRDGPGLVARLGEAVLALASLASAGFVLTFGLVSFDSWF